MNDRVILVTGAAGLMGQALLRRMAQASEPWTVIAADTRPTPLHGPQQRMIEKSVTDTDWQAVMQREGVTHVVHLVALITPPPSVTPEMWHAIDVKGTQALYEASVRAGVRQFVWLSSMAAYGYSPGMPVPATEDTPIRPHPVFPYSAHKAELEQWFAAMPAHEGPRRLILRPSLILDEGTDNTMTSLFRRETLLGFLGSEVNFSIIWAEDLVDAMLHGIEHHKGGAFNTSGDGHLTLADIARLTGKPLRRVPFGGLVAWWTLLNRLGIPRGNPRYLDALRYRPILDNTRMKEVLGYTPKVDAREAFIRWWSSLPARQHC